MLFGFIMFLLLMYYNCLPSPCDLPQFTYIWQRQNIQPCVIRGGLGDSAEGSGADGVDGGGSWVGGEYANVIDITF